MSKILVTGAAGFVGSYAVNYFIKQGHEIRATDLPHKSIDIDLAANDKLEWIGADLRDKKELDMVFDGTCDLLFNPASLYDYSAPIDLMREVNVQGTENLLETAQDYNWQQIVHLSTCDVFGRFDEDEKPYTEDSPKYPSTNYQTTKWEQEQLVRSYHDEHGLPVSVLRPMPIYGPGSSYGVSMAIFMLAKGQIPGIPGSGKSRTTFIHVRDVVKASLHLLKGKGAEGEPYIICDDSHYTSEEILKYAASLLDTKVYSFKIPVPAIKLISKWCEAIAGDNRPKIEQDPLKYLTQDYLLSNEKLKGTGYQLEYPDSKQGLKQTFQWYKEHDRLYNSIKPLPKIVKDWNRRN